MTEMMQLTTRPGANDPAAIDRAAPSPDLVRGAAAPAVVPPGAGRLAQAQYRLCMREFVDPGRRPAGLAALHVDRRPPTPLSAPAVRGGKDEA